MKSAMKYTINLSHRFHFLTGSILIPALLCVVSLAYAQDEGTPAAQAARSVATRFATELEEIKTKLAEYAASEPVRELFMSKNEAQLNAEAERAVSQFPSALKLRLFIPGTYDLDNESSPPLSYGSIAALNKAENSSGPIAIETLLFGTDNQHIVMVERVNTLSNQLIGFVHLSLDVELIQDMLTRVNPVDAYVEIMQSAGNSPLILAGTGIKEYQEDEPITVSINGTRWTLAYWRAPPGLIESVRVTFMESFLENFLLRHFNAIAALLVLFIVATMVAHKKSSNKETYVPMDSDVTYAGSIKAIMEGAHPGMEKLIGNMPGKKSAPVQRESIKVVNSGDSGSDAESSKSRLIDTQNPFVSGIVVEEDGEDSKDFLSEEDIQALSGTTEVFDITQGDEEGDGSDEEKFEIPEVIFRKYDIRGIVGDTLTRRIVYKIGQAVGSEAAIKGVKAIAVGRDGRLSSPDLTEGLIKGICSTGTDVIDIGVVPTPILYFATHHLGTQSGIMVTGSHNGPEYNGLKIVLDGNTLSEDEIKQIYNRICESNFSTGTGKVNTSEVIPEYIRRISDDIPAALGNSYKLVIDCGNGAASVAAAQLYRALGHDVVELYCELDGNFPNHHPDPSQPENLESLISKVKEVQADLGFAFDGDGDRLGVVDNQGKVLWPDRQMMLFAKDVLSRNQGAEIIFDVKCSSHLKKIIEESGGKPLMWKTGHSLIKGKMKEANAPLAGEMSGHIFFSERWYGFDDALYSGARMLEILMNLKSNPAEVFAALPDSVSTPELKIDMPESEHQAFMTMLEDKMSFEDSETITVDGFRVEFKDGWGLIRPSNTTPCLVVRFEADTPESLNRIRKLFKDLLLSIKPELNIPF